MGEKINKEFEKFQKELSIKEAKLKYPIKFEVPNELNTIIDELNNKKILE